MGKKFELDLIFADSKQMTELNKKYRNRDKDTNVLSFNLSPDIGQIFINPEFAKKEAPTYERSYKSHLWALYIHGLLHLKGYNHGKDMEKKEKTLCRGI